MVLEIALDLDRSARLASSALTEDRERWKEGPLRAGFPL